MIIVYFTNYIIQQKCFSVIVILRTIQKDLKQCFLIKSKLTINTTFFPIAQDAHDREGWIYLAQGTQAREIPWRNKKISGRYIGKIGKSFAMPGFEHTFNLYKC